jgi:hypothetical protein
MSFAGIFSVQNFSWFHKVKLKSENTEDDVRLFGEINLSTVALGK